MRLKQFFTTIVVLCFMSVSVLASEAEPLTILKDASGQMITVLTHHKGRIKQDPPFLERTVRKLFVPYFTVDTMARSVLGRDAWQKASPAQREAFKKEFTDMVIGVYAAPLADFNDDRVKFYPLSAQAIKSSRVQIKSVLIRKTGQRIAVNYRMAKIRDQWKIYDFSIEGISMIQSYRSQFSSVLRQSGFSGLLKQLQQHNMKA